MTEGSLETAQPVHNLPILRLQEVLAALNSKSVELPSAGSAGHFSGRCKPCAFVHTSGCASGNACVFCHVCEPGEKKRRQKNKKELFRSMRHIQKIATVSWPVARAGHT